MNINNYTLELEILAEAPLFIDDTPALSVFELRAKCRRLKAQHDIQLIIIDYLQLMTAGGEGKGNTENKKLALSQDLLKVSLKNLDVPIIALSQLSRSVETRGGDKRPMLIRFEGIRCHRTRCRYCYFYLSP